MINLIISIIHYAFNIYTFMIIIYILMSWVPAARDSSIGQLLGKLCEPYLGFFRKFIPPIGMVDISPIVALFLLQFIEKGIYIVLLNVYQMIM